jgi:hypothetical protein
MRKTILLSDFLARKLTASVAWFRLIHATEQVFGDEPRRIGGLPFVE